MLVKRLKTAIDSCWAKYLAFRVAFVATFIFSMIIISFYAFLVSRPLFGWLVPVLLAIYYSRRYRAESPAAFRGKYWWFPLVLSTLYMAFFSHHNYALNQIDSLAFSATLCGISGGCLVYYSMRWKRS